MFRSVGPLLLVVVFVAGCMTGPPTEPQEPGATSTVSGTESPRASENETDPGIPDDVIPRSIQFDGCTYWSVTSFMPDSLAPGEAPEGWRDDGPEEPVGFIESNGHRCEKISIGGFERGPIMFITDAHGKGQVPEGCLEGIPSPSNTIAVLHRLYIEDAELAEFLNATYDMPVTLADIQDSVEPVGSAELNEWTWTPIDGEPSTVTIPYEGQSLEYGDYLHRFFWEWGTGLVMLDLETEQTRALAGGRLSTGTFGSPSIFAEFADGHFAGNGEWYPTATTSGTFTLYRDRLCQDSIPDPDA